VVWEEVGIVDQNLNNKFRNLLENLLLFSAFTTKIAPLRFINKISGLSITAHPGISIAQLKKSIFTRRKLLCEVPEHGMNEL